MMMKNSNNEASDNDVSSDELVEGEDGELYRKEIRNGKNIFTKPRHDSTQEKAEPTKNVFAVGVLVI